MRQELKSLTDKVAKSEVRRARVPVSDRLLPLTATTVGGARRGGAPVAGRARDADAIRHGVA